MGSLLRFDGYEIDLAAGQLYKHGARVPLRDQAFRVLAALVERPGQAVTREELRHRLWPDEVFVDFDNVLNSAIARLREALGDSADHPRFIETLPKHGYRFLASISEPIAIEETPAARRPRLLVLPFVNLSRDAAQEYLSDAMTDEVITALAGLASDALAVIARTTAMRYKGRQKNVARIARELGVDYVVEGAVRRAGDSVTVNAQLVRAGDQAHIWAKRHDSPLDDAFGIPGPIAQAIAGALGIKARSGEGACGPAVPARKIAHDPIAYNEYVQGCYHLDRFNMFMPGFEAGRDHLEKAVARDPDFALAYEGLARWYSLQSYVGVMPPREAFAAGILHAVRAVEIDSNRAETHALLAQYHKQLDYNWPDIERELARALQLDPASSFVRMLYALSCLMPQGRVQDAIAELERALELDPLSFAVHVWLGVMCMLARDWDRGIDEARLLIELEPMSAWGPWLMGTGFRGKGLLDAAIDAHRRAVDLSGDSPMMLGWLGLTLGSSGKTDEARSVLERLEAMACTRYVPPTSFAWVYLGLRQVDRAFEWLDRAIDARDQFMMPIKSYAFFDPIRADPRFTTLLRKMKLA